ncbi:unnamed protein product [Echinostoma caproni]|uniref:CUB domain-containing protein n=1 Tax=Echinostoma caproni TaxID=27848 RepID=A0A183AL61_9TREM|nr:unnamed protein product [Echinostoma caproni]
MRVDGNITLDCVHEIPEAWHDSYIVRMNHQDNGCHARDLCLEFDQGRKDYLLRTDVTYSHKRDTPFKDVCNFQALGLSSVNLFQTVRPRVLIRTTNRTGNDPGSKCGIYQLRIEGTAHLLHNSLSPDPNENGHVTTDQFRTSRSLPYVTRRDGYSPASNQDRFKNVVPLQITYPSIEASWFEEPLFLKYYRTQPSCRVEMTDFNANLGSTGEFDNQLRLYTSCDGLYAPFLQLTEFLCMSVHTIDTISPALARYSMLITYSSVLDQYFCWLIKSTNQNSTQLFVLILFPSPQCPYEWTSLGDIRFDPREALAIFFMSPGECKTSNINRKKSNHSDNCVYCILWNKGTDTETP